MISYGPKRSRKKLEAFSARRSSNNSLKSKKEEVSNIEPKFTVRKSKNQILKEKL